MPAPSRPVGQPVQPRLSRRIVLVMAVATGLAVANTYYAQPLLPVIRADLGLSPAAAGLVVTLAQLGYALGLVLVLPLGDLLERRGLLVALAAAAAGALAWLGSAHDAGLLLPAAVAVGTLSVQAQLLVPFAATLAADEERGRVIGTVMSGLLLGVLLARTVAGYLATLGTWRLVYFVAAGLMLAQSAVLAAALPRHRERLRLGYPALLASVVRIWREEPVLRLRCAFGALSFGAFSVLWTSLAFLLAGAPYRYGSATIGLFGVAGAAGALAANAAGRVADRGGAGTSTGVTSLLLAVSWVPLALGRHHLGWLLAGIVLLDVAAQGLHVTNQSQIYRLRPDARSRINSAYMTTYFAGGTAGSAASAAAYGAAGWPAVCGVGAGFGVATTAVWVLTSVRSGSVAA